MNEKHESIGLIGVGLLGTAIAERLLRSGRHVCGYDLRPGQPDALVAAGGKRLESAAQVLAGCETIITCLPGSDVCAKVLSENVDLLRAGQTIIDTTTGDPQQMVTIGETMRAKGVAYIEATVAGSSSQVRAGNACLFLGGDEQTIGILQELLVSIAPKCFSLGPVGAASRFKLVHNLVLGLNRAVLAEGLSFSESLGFAPADVLEILKETPAASMVMESKGKKMVSGDHQPQARLSQHLKDVRLIVAAAQGEGLEMPLSVAHQRLLEQAEALGFGDADNSAVIEAYRQRAEDKV